MPYLPKSQLVSQWKELNSIFKKQDKHLLINYIYNYEKSDLLAYSKMVVEEMVKRGIKIKSWDNFTNYFHDLVLKCNKDHPFYEQHTKDYLLKNFMNLEEKYFCGQKDFDRDTYLRLWNFVNDELNGLLEEIGKKLKEE